MMKRCDDENPSDVNKLSPVVYVQVSPTSQPIVYPLKIEIHMSSKASWKSEISTSQRKTDGMDAVDKIKPPQIKNGNNINGVISAVDRTPPMHEMIYPRDAAAFAEKHNEKMYFA